MDRCYFDVWPKVVRADRETEIKVRPRFDHVAFKAQERIVVKYVRDDGGLRDGGCAPWGGFTEIPFRREGDLLRITQLFEGECEHAFQVVAFDAENRERTVVTFYIYSLADDLFVLRPFKGDFHIHSFRSDGLESPAYVAASARKVGMDFMALTDHHQYEPSLEAIASMKGFETDLRCYPGEEVHGPDNPVHIVNFGGSFSVNELFQKDESAFRAEVGRYEEALPGDLHPSLRYQIAASEWAFDQIRKGGGISIYCHPYWRPLERYYVHSKVNDVIMDRQRFDALEVIGGFYRHQMESNALAVSRYHEDRSKGKHIPVVGVSDAHGCDRDLFGWYYTIVLARSVEFRDLAGGITGLNSVAVEAVPGEFPRLIGTFRQVRYVYFLMREYFPMHDKLCCEEGELILGSMGGDTTAGKRLAVLKGRVPSLLQKYWAE
jgi:hypothetical protein